MQKKAASLACALTISLTHCPAAFCQGDPVPPVTPPAPQLPPVQVPTTPQPNVLQILQQQIQIQNQIQNVQFPPYLQANPTISPLDQRSGLIPKSIKINSPIPVNLTTTTVKVPNIINSSLIAPTNTEVTTVQAVPMPATGDVQTTAKEVPTKLTPVTPTNTTTATTTRTPSKVPGPITISKPTGTTAIQTTKSSTTTVSSLENPSDINTEFAALDKQLQSMIDQALSRLTSANDRFNNSIDTAMNNMQDGNTKRISVSDAPNIQADTAKDPVAPPTIATSSTGKEIVDKLTKNFLDFPSLTKPEDRQRILLDMVNTLAVFAPAMDKAFQEDLIRLTKIAVDPNNPAIKTGDSTEARMLMNALLPVLASKQDQIFIEKISLDKVDVNDKRAVREAAQQKLDAKMAEIESKIKQQEKNSILGVSGAGTAVAGGLVAITGVALSATGIGAGAGLALIGVGIAITGATATDTASGGKAQTAISDGLKEFGRVVSGTAAGAAKAGVEQAKPVQAERQAAGQAPSAPTVNMTQLQNDFNSAANELGNLNSLLQSKTTQLANLNKSISTASTQQQRDMYKSQAQRLGSEIATLSADKAKAENKFLTSFAKMYGSDSATQLSKAITGNPDTGKLQSIASGLKP